MKQIDTDAPQIAGNVRAELARQRVSGSLAARAAGISKRTFYRRLDGELTFREIELRRLADLLNVPVGVLAVGPPWARGDWPARNDARPPVAAPAGVR